MHGVPDQTLALHKVHNPAATVSGAADCHTVAIGSPIGALVEMHHTQGLYMATITLQIQQDATGCSRRVCVLSSLAPLAGSKRFYNSTPQFKALQRVPQHSLSSLSICLHGPGVFELIITLSSFRYAMLGNAAAAAGISSEAWLAGPNCADCALCILAGPMRQSFIYSNSSSSKTSNTAATMSAKLSTTRTAQQEVPTAVVYDPAYCIGCNTRAAGRPMQHCT